MPMVPVNPIVAKKSGGGIFGKIFGGLAGAIAAPFTGGLSIPAAIGLGAGVGSTVGGAVGEAVKPGSVSQPGGPSQLEIARTVDPDVQIGELSKAQEAMMSSPEIPFHERKGYFDLFEKAKDPLRGMIK